jgi:hypothetical protein
VCRARSSYFCADAGRVFGHPGRSIVYQCADSCPIDSSTCGDTFNRTSMVSVIPGVGARNDAVCSVDLAGV